jgi:hypothetical protein
MSRRMVQIQEEEEDSWDRKDLERAEDASKDV